MNPMRVSRWNRARKEQVSRSVERIVCLSLLCAWLGAPTVRAQPATGGGGGFAPGAREIFSLNLAQEPLGEFPKSVRQLSGSMEVVEKDGQRMLRASTESEFLITLPERLPERFTLEFDLITRAAGYNSFELSFEGTPTVNRSGASAQVTWRQSGVTLFGGRDADTSSNLHPMPDDVQAEIEGQLAEVRVEFVGNHFKMYTNGRRIHSVPALKFVRARVLRVGLNGVDGKQYAVHLARLRIADAATTMPPGGSVATNTSTPQVSSPSSPGSREGSSLGTPTAITGINVTVNANGMAMVTWNALPVPATYFVVRWNANDPSCCNAMSPPGIPLTSPMWQDSMLPVQGTYVYRVIAKTANGTIEGEARFNYTGAPTPPPGIASTPPVQLTPPVSERITSYTPPLVSPTPTPSPPASGSGTGAPSAGTVATTPPPTAPYSSGPRTVSVYEPPTTSPTPTSTASGRTNVALVGATGPGTIVSPEPAPTPTATPVTALPAVVTGTIVPMTPSTSTGDSSITSTRPNRDVVAAPETNQSNPSGGPGYVTSPRFRVMLTGFAVAKVTNDDPLGADGKGDEAFAVAAVLHWDRSTNQKKSFSFLQTRAYGEVGTLLPFPDRIQGGTVTDKGGLAAGNKIPSDDPEGNTASAPSADRFPLALWEGELTAGVDSLVVAPSLWERDAIRTHFNNYKSNWEKFVPVELATNQAVMTQYTTASLTSALIPLSPLVALAPPSPTFSGAVTNGYKIAAPAFGPSNDRPIGMSAKPGELVYQERVTLITREKLFTLNAGQGITIAIPCVEPIDPLLGGLYTLYLRVQRVQ